MAKKSLVVGFVLDDGLDSEDGVQNYILTLGHQMKKLGHQVHYIVGETKRDDIKNLHSLSKNLNVKFNGNKLSIPLPVSKKKINHLLDEVKFDILHVQMPYSPFYGQGVIKLASKRSDIKLIGTFHILPYSFWSKFGSIILGLWIRRSTKSLHQVISVSEPAQKFAKKYYHTTSIVVPNTVNIDLYRNTAKKIIDNNQRIKLLFLGRLVERKGCQYLIEALNELEKNHPNLNYHLNICGKGPMLSEIRQKIVKHGLLKKVTFQGFVTEVEKIKFMQTCDLAIFPSVSGESFGIVLIEAMAASGGVVLAGNNQGYASVMSDTPECLINPKDIQKFAKKLEEFILSPDLRRAMFDKQQEQVKKFETSKVVKQILKIYNGQ